jgi:hypothetical protein
MDFKEAFEKHFVMRTEYGAGPELLGGLFTKRELKRRRYWLDGRTEDDVVHERVWSLGPVSVAHRSREKNLLGAADYELAVTLFGLFAVSNDKEFLVKVKAGPSASVLKLLGAAMPALEIPGKLADLNCAARAGVRFNVTRLIKDLKNDGSGEPSEPEPEDIDLS